MKKYYALSLVLGIIGTSGYGAEGLIGGQDLSGNAYASFVDSSNGNLTPILGTPTDSIIYVVAINNLGNGVIGGQAAGDGYSALVSSNGTLTPLAVDFSSGKISAAAINSSGNGLIAGDDFSGSYYIAQVAPDGTLTPVTLTSAVFSIDATALNDDGVGLIGGEGATPLPYAAYLSSNGTETPLVIDGAVFGHIYGASLNAKANGVIGGWMSDGTNIFAYAGLTTANQTSVVGLPSLPINGLLFSVAINSAGLSLVGGVDGSNNIYVAYADSSGNTTPLFNSPVGGSVYSVALNDSGTGLIGGIDGSSNAYAALVEKNGSVQALFASPSPGQINSVAITDTGVGLIGGTINSQGYAALVAPNGSLTVLDLVNLVSIEYVALGDVESMVTPTSVGSFSNVSYAQFAASSALETRFSQKNRVWKQSQTPSVAAVNFAECDELVAAAGPLWGRKKEETAQQPNTKNSIWIGPFGNYVHLQAEGKLPSMKNQVGGILLGYDRQEENYMVGGGLGYAFNYVRYGQDLGHGKINEETACVYGAWYSDHFWIGSALWGGIYQFSNLRRGASLVTAKAFTRGGLLAPHLEMATPWALSQSKRFFIEPFVMFDWVNSWQKGFTEKGSSGFNVTVKSMYGSVLQSEAGLRFYEKFGYEWGDFCLEEKLSYVNQAPFFSGSQTTAFVASSATFPIAVASTKVQNMGSFQLMSVFQPKNHSYPFGGFDLQATAGSSYQSYFASVFIGMDF